MPVLRSRRRAKLHHVGEAGTGAVVVMQCESGSDTEAQHKNNIKNDTNSNSKKANQMSNYY
jgi:hypothetical protein